MNFSYGLLPDELLWFSSAVVLTLLALAVWRAPWKSLLDSRKVNIYLGSIVGLLLLWQMSAGLNPGLNYHLLGGTLLVLMFGWQLAYVAMIVVVLGTMVNGAGDLQSLGVNMLIMGAVPIFVSQGALLFARRFLPHHFFVYVMGNGFITGGLTMIATVSAATAMLVCCSAYTFDQLLYDYLPFAPLMTFAEAFFTGMLATSLVLFRPEWIWTFDDRVYLSGK